MSTLDYLHLAKVAAPEILVVLAALGLLTADLLWMRGHDLRTRAMMSAMIGAAGCAAAIGWTLVVPAQEDFFNGMFVVNPMTQLVKALILGLTIFALWIPSGRDFTNHVGEHFALVLLSAVGMMFLASAENTLMVFVSLELTSLPLYILTGLNKSDPKSAEAALKYFFFGGMAAAFLLYGLSLLYGITGSTSLAKSAVEIGIKLKTGDGLDPVLAVALVLTITGFGFKIAAVPFHLWAPDAYQGAPTSVAAFIASGSKLASFFVFAKVMTLGLGGVTESAGWHGFVAGWAPVLALLAALSMVLGNLAALAQTSVKRLLAYSAIAHSGYMLLGVLGHGWESTAALVFYAATYGLATLGAFGVVAIVEEISDDDRLANFSGLSRRAPFATFCMMIFILSLAGIPPLAGFFAKFYLFATVLHAGSGEPGLLWLVILAIAASAVSLYYYLQVLKQIFVSAPAPANPAIETPVVSLVVLGLIALLVVVLGCAPNLLVGALNASLAAAGLR